MRERRGDDLRELKETEERCDSRVAEAETEGRRRAAAVVVAAAEREVIAADVECQSISRWLCCGRLLFRIWGRRVEGSYLEADSPLLFPFLQFFQVTEPNFLCLQ